MQKQSNRDNKNSIHSLNNKQIARKMMIQWISLIKEIHSKKDEEGRGLIVLINPSSVISLIKKMQWIKLHHRNTHSLGIQKIHNVFFLGGGTCIYMTRFRALSLKIARWVTRYNFICPNIIVRCQTKNTFKYTRYLL